ncbi:ACP S-malonyltransferase [Okibacterium endophyticum]
MIVIVCPGQGSQTPGFLAPWLENESARLLMESYSAASGVDLIAHGTTSDADTIRDTAVAQPLIVAAGLVTMRALADAGVMDHVSGIAGHSVGEVTAAAGAGVLGEASAMRFVAARANAMAAAAAAEATGMSAVIGADDEALQSRLAELGLEAANYNGGGQIVVAGALDALAEFSESPLPGTRVIPLQVAGAFHTRYMRSAQSTLRNVAAELDPADPALTLWTNNDGSAVTSGERFTDLLVEQVASPVRWDRCMSAFADAGVTGIIELAPAGALVGLAKRALKGIPTVAVKHPNDIAAALELARASA